MKKAQGNFVKRLIAAALIFLIPFIIEFILLIVFLNVIPLFNFVKFPVVITIAVSVLYLFILFRKEKIAEVLKPFHKENASFSFNEMNEHPANSTTAMNVMITTAMLFLVS